MVNKYNNIFKELKNNVSVKEGEKILIVDAMNMFIRNFTIKNKVNPNGHHVGGLIGFLISLGYVSKLFRPDRIYIAFEGEGSSLRRKHIFPGYKMNRNLKSITKWEYFKNKEEEKESLEDQVERLSEYLECLPVIQIKVNGLEGDDIISHLVSEFEKKDNIDEITIVSADQDFIQLISDKTQIYSPRKRQVVQTNDVLNEYNIHPNNFIIKKIIEGDPSDNIPGVKGIGPKKIKKHFTELLNENKFTLDDLYLKCEEGDDNVFNSILNFKHQLDINNKLMNLHDLNLSDVDIETINKIISSDNPNPDPFRFTNYTNQDLIQSSFRNPTTWVRECFSSIN